MTESVLLVLAGGLVGIVSALVPILLQRRWQIADRRRAADNKALEGAVQRLMAWQAFAVQLLASGEIPEAHRRLLDLDTLWEADLTLIPDQEATREMLRLSKLVNLSPGFYQRGPNGGMEEMSRLMELLDRVILSAQKKRRELA